MFPATHIHCAKQITGLNDPLLFYGAIFPDIPITGIITGEAITARAADFAQYIENTYPELQPFARGIRLHEQPFGIDQFVHGEEGYAFTEGKKIAQDISKHIPTDVPDACHSFVEFAIEILMVENRPELIQNLRNATQAGNTALTKIAQATSTFFQTDPKKTQQSIAQYNAMLQKMTVETKEQAVQAYTWLTNKIRNTNLTQEVVGNLLDKAKEKIEDNYKEFLEKTIQECKNMESRA